MTAHANARSPGTWPSRFAGALIVLAGLIAYSNSFQVPFVFDDIASIQDNPALRDWSSFADPPPTALTLIGRPLVSFTLAAQLKASGFNLGALHAFNLAVHLACGLILYGLIRRLARPTGGPGIQQLADPVGAVAAWLWTVHPLQTESVTYIVQRAESLGALCYLLTLHASVRSVTSRRPHLWCVLACGACWLGMAAKETVVSAPLAVMLLDRVFLFPTWSAAWKRRKPLYLGLMASWCLLGWLVAGAGDRGGSAGYAGPTSALAYAANQPAWIVWYLRLAVWPAPLVFDYGQELISDPRVLWASSCALVLLVAALAWLSKKRPTLGFLALTSAAILAPSSSIVPLYGQVAAEHRMYLPLAAVIIVLVECLARVAWRLARGDAVKAQRIVWCAGAALALCGMTGTWHRNRTYRSGEALWEDTVRQRPGNVRALNNLAEIYLNQGRIPEAVTLLHRALAARPDHAFALNNLGTAHVHRREFAAALECFERSIALRPDFAAAHANRGTVLAQLGQSQQALASLIKATELEPRNWQFQNGLGCAYRDVRNAAAALRSLTAATELSPDSPLPYYNRGGVLARLGRRAEARRDFETFSRLQKNAPSTYIARARAWLAAGEPQEAQRDLSQAEAHGPTHPKLRAEINRMLSAESRD